MLLVCKPCDHACQLHEKFESKAPNPRVRFFGMRITTQELVVTIS
jgi:hypothetical protein